MITFHIDNQTNDWTNLAMHIASIWPVENMCIIAQDQSAIDQIESSIIAIPNRFISISQSCLHPSTIYVSTAIPQAGMHVINTSTQQLDYVTTEWVRSEKEKARLRFKHWRNNGHEIQTITHT